MAAAAKQSANTQRIDPLSNLTERRIYAFSGTDDSVVRTPAVNATTSFFELVGVKKSNLIYVHDVPAGHAVIAPGYGNDCSANSAPYISHCTLHGKSYDQAGALLTHIYGELQPRVDVPSGSIVSFNQRAYAAASTGMAGIGYLYVPPTCAAGEGCKMHVAIHGCLQAAGSADGKFGDQFYTKTGYNNWADNNHILLLYPQLESGRSNNPQDCWDWWGYSSTKYAYKVRSAIEGNHGDGAAARATAVSISGIAESISDRKVARIPQTGRSFLRSANSAVVRRSSSSRRCVAQPPNPVGVPPITRLRVRPAHRPPTRTPCTATISPPISGDGHV
jgi:hypothetical protein